MPKLSVFSCVGLVPSLSLPPSRAAYTDASHKDLTLQLSGAEGN